MANEIYFGIDESYDLLKSRNIATALCVSRNPLDVKENGVIEKKRYLDTETLEKDSFIYTYKDKEKKRLEICLELIHAAFIKYLDEDEIIKVFIDGERWSVEEIEKLCTHPAINYDSLEFVVRGDKRIPLINRADHIANMLKRLYSDDPNIYGNTTLFRESYPEIYTRLKNSRI